jgi:hypothetical protein
MDEYICGKCDTSFTSNYPEWAHVSGEGLVPLCHDCANRLGNEIDDACQAAFRRYAGKPEPGISIA